MSDETLMTVIVVGALVLVVFFVWMLRRGEKPNKTYSSTREGLDHVDTFLIADSIESISDTVSAVADALDDDR